MAAIARGRLDADLQGLGLLLWRGCKPADIKQLTGFVADDDLGLAHVLVCVGIQDLEHGHGGEVLADA